MLDARAPADRTFCAPLPSPAMSRQLILVARSGELGSIPQRIADMARQAFETRAVPDMVRAMPWLSDKLKLG